MVAAQRAEHRPPAVLIRGEQRRVPMWMQAAALLDRGFALQAGTAPIGVRVDGPPAAASDGTGPQVDSPVPAPATSGSGALYAGPATVAVIVALAGSDRW